MFAVQFIRTVFFFCLFLHNVQIKECTFVLFEKLSYRSNKKISQIQKYKNKRLLWSKVSLYKVNNSRSLIFQAQYDVLFKALRSFGRVPHLLEIMSFEINGWFGCSSLSLKSTKPILQTLSNFEIIKSSFTLHLRDNFQVVQLGTTYKIY